MYFDIGANVGKWSLANLINSDKIITIEASPITFNKLTKSINSDKIECLNYAVCNNNGQDITFYHSHQADTLSTLNKDWLTSPKSRFCNYGYNEIICKTITIDKLIEIYGVPELIKIDVEGGEYECVSSLNTKVNILCFEWASETNDITFKCLTHLKNIGFNYFSIQNQDDYTYRPLEYTNIDEVIGYLNKTIPKIDWGMVWCK
jgi:FkbM family methyltransferase